MTTEEKNFIHFTDVMDMTIKDFLEEECNVRVYKCTWDLVDKTNRIYLSGFKITTPKNNILDVYRNYEEVPTDALKRALEICETLGLKCEAVKGVACYPWVNFVVYYRYKNKTKKDVEEFENTHPFEVKYDFDENGDRNGYELVFKDPKDQEAYEKLLEEAYYF